MKPVKVGEDAKGEDYLTFPCAKPDRAIDWILCSPELEVTKTWAVQSGLSDHLMVVGRVGSRTWALQSSTDEARAWWPP